MTKNCYTCQTPFEITPDDIVFLKKMSPVFNDKTYTLPLPENCPTCRHQHRYAFRNERSFHQRVCDLCKKTTISLYSPESPYVIYCSTCWWNDQFDPKTYGQEFNFGKSFFEQFQELNLKVPKLAIQNTKSENCNYTNYSAENKNCYLVVGTLRSEDCYYSYRTFYSKNIIDGYDLYKCELCYDCTDCKELYNSQHCLNCHNSSDLSLCENLTGCRNCFGCINLNNKEYHIFNKPYSKEDYELKVTELKRDIPKTKTDFQNFRLKFPQRANQIVNSENSTGDHLINCKNCSNCYTYKYSEDCKFACFGEDMKDCRDISTGDSCELQYNSANLQSNYNVIGGNLTWYSKNCYYIWSCFNSADLFGCTGMKKNQYCILNKQYSKEEYFNLIPNIIKHMMDNSVTHPLLLEKEKWPGNEVPPPTEWGAYFPKHLSPFSYHETYAGDFAPLTKEEAQKLNFNWFDYEQPLPKVDKIIDANQLPDNIDQIPDDILSWAIKCQTTGKLFRIIPQELKFYRANNIAIPKEHPDVRHKNRQRFPNPKKMFQRQCEKCKNPIETKYSPNNLEIVYCETCYQKDIY